MGDVYSLVPCNEIFQTEAINRLKYATIAFSINVLLINFCDTEFYYLFTCSLPFQTIKFLQSSYSKLYFLSHFHNDFKAYFAVIQTSSLTKLVLLMLCLDNVSL